MSTTLEDVLNCICTEVALTLTNDFQKVYTVSTPFDAKLAHEVLVVFGLDVKVYHQADKPSKLYVTHPRFSAEQLARIYGAALTYARAMKTIQSTVNDLCTQHEAAVSVMDYNITFHKGQGNTKNLLIQMTPSSDGMKAQLESSDTPPAPQASPAQSGPAAPQQPAAAANSTSAVMAASQARAAKYRVAKRTDHYEELSAGTAVGRGNYPGKLTAEGEAKANSVKRRAALMMFGNMTMGSFPMLVMTVILAVIFSIFVMMKGFMCADLAVAKKNKAWYCSYDDQQAPRQQQ
ncbi:MAG: hypothetical protein EBV03_14055, partial [Proteobacteria bacterium]|nr:hypothetical protein [Pseudomonadota bacterium]